MVRLFKSSGKSLEWLIIRDGIETLYVLLQKRSLIVRLLLLGLGVCKDRVER